MTAIGRRVVIHAALRRAFVAYAIRYRKLRSEVLVRIVYSTLEKRIAATSVDVVAG